MFQLNDIVALNGLKGIVVEMFDDAKMVVKFTNDVEMDFMTSGKLYPEQDSAMLTLVERPIPIREVTGYVNLFAGGRLGTKLHPTEQAARAAGLTGLAVIKVTGTYEARAA